MVDWKDKNISQVAAMLREGLSASQIARRMTVALGAPVTKNSIVGLCHRKDMKLNGRKLRPKPAAKPRVAKQPSMPKRPKREPQVTELGTKHCQWLYGEATDRNFCKKPAVRIEGTRFSSSSWCLEHAKVVYTPPKPNSREVQRLTEALPRKGTL